MTPFELAQLRADTPGVAQRIHLNNCGAALMPRPVIEAVHRHIDLEAAVGGYEAADLKAAEIAPVYDSVARLIGAEPRRWRCWRTPPWPGTWPSTGCAFARATGF